MTRTKQEQYEFEARYNMGHAFIGFEGLKCSRMDSDDRKRTLAECAWVWDTRRKRWIKRPGGAT